MNKEKGVKNISNEEQIIKKENQRETLPYFLMCPYSFEYKLKPQVTYLRKAQDRK